jgi:hypothetical protein
LTWQQLDALGLFEGKFLSVGMRIFGGHWFLQFPLPFYPFPGTGAMQKSPRDVVETWVARFNAADVDGLADLYHPDAINHQVVQNPVVGRDEIRAMFGREFAAAKMTCIVETIHDAGEVIALEWRDPRGRRGCGFFTIRDGRIAFQRGYWDRLSFIQSS